MIYLVSNKQPELLLFFIMSIKTNEWSWLHKHTGSCNINDYVLTNEELDFYKFPRYDLLEDAVKMSLNEPTYEKKINKQNSSSLIRSDLLNCTKFKPTTKSITKSTRIFSLDTESVKTNKGIALSQVVLVEYLTDQENKYHIICDLLIKPNDQIIDYLTAYSGMTKELLATAKITWEEARDIICGIITNNDILIGHDLRQDLMMLGIVHEKVIDTTILYALSTDLITKPKLSDLVKIHLRRSIQVNQHQASEDAIATLELAMQVINSCRGRICVSRIETQPNFYELDTNKLLKLIEIDVTTVECLYLHGSRAIGTNNYTSDWDFFMVIKNDIIPNMTGEVHIKYGNIDVTMFEERVFTKLVQQHYIWVLKALFSPNNCRWIENINYRETLENYRIMVKKEVYLPQLRASTSYESSRKWHSAKKALLVGNYNRCYKHIFICLRFLIYGIDVATTGKINDICSANYLWNDLSKETIQDWPSISKKYSPLRKQLSNTFKTLTPKLVRNGGFRKRIVNKSRTKTFIAATPIKLLNHKETLNTLSYPTSSSLSIPKYTLSTISTINEYLSKLETQDKAFEYLQSLHIQVTSHKQFPNIVSLHYTHQSPEDHPHTIQCRGLILDTAEKWNIVALPFDRFFNIQDKNSNKIKNVFDWSSAIEETKLDGSIAILYFNKYNNTWSVASSHVPDGENKIGVRNQDNLIKFADLFWEIWNKINYNTEKLNKNYTYIFEMITPRNIIIIRYSDEQLYLIGVRNNITKQELNTQIISQEFGFLTSQSIKLDQVININDTSNIEKQILQRTSLLNSNYQEGVIIKDCNFNRFKVKNAGYVQASWMFPLCPHKYQVNDKHLLSVILSNNQKEFEIYCPEFIQELKKVQKVFDDYCNECEVIYSEIKNLSDAKIFAVVASSYGKSRSKVLFTMKKNQLTAKDVMCNFNTHQVSKIIFSN